MTRTTGPTAWTLRLIGIGALITVSGCFSLGRKTPPLQEYVLGESVRAESVTRAPDAGGLTVGLRRLDLAPYLATTAIVVRRGSRIETTSFRRWAEEPTAGIMRAVAVSLRAAPAILAVDIAPWQVRARHDYLVQLHISHLEGVAADNAGTSTGEVHVMASWEIIRAQDGTLVARGATDRREPGWTVGDYLGLVTRIDTGLVGLAGDVAACLGRLAPAPTPTPMPMPTPTLTPAPAPAPTPVLAEVRLLVCGVR